MLEKLLLDLRKSYFRSVFNRFLIGLLLLIVVPSITLIVSELNSRVTAEAFIREELQLVRRQSAQVPKLNANTTAAQTSEASSPGFLISILAKELELRERRAVEVQKSLIALTVTGTSNGSGTVDALIGNYVAFLIERAKGGTDIAQADLVKQKINAELAFIESVLTPIQNLATASLSQYATKESAETLLRSVTSSIPALFETQFP